MKNQKFKIIFRIFLPAIVFFAVGLTLERKVSIPTKISFSVAVSGKRGYLPKDYSYDDYYLNQAAVAKAQSIAIYLRSGAVSEKVIKEAQAEMFCSPKEKFFETESFEGAASLFASFLCKSEINKETLQKMKASLEKTLDEEFVKKWDEEQIEWKVSVTDFSDVGFKIPKYLIATLFFISGILLGIFLEVAARKKN